MQLGHRQRRAAFYSRFQVSDRSPRIMSFASAGGAISVTTERRLNLVATQPGAGLKRHGDERMIHPRPIVRAGDRIDSGKIVDKNRQGLDL
jgi:hypothetical protein